MRLQGGVAFLDETCIGVVFAAGGDTQWLSGRIQGEVVLELSRINFCINVFPIVGVSSPCSSSVVESSAYAKDLQAISDVLGVLVRGARAERSKQTLFAEKLQYFMIVSMSATLPGTGRGG